MFNKKSNPQQETSAQYTAPLPIITHPTANVRQLQQRWDLACVILPVAKVADPNDRLKQFGQAGWELVSVQTFDNGVLGLCREFYFKRPIVESA